MPIYEYRCGNCKKSFELQQKIEEREKGVCPGCGSAEVEKLFSVFGIGVAGSLEKNDTSACGPENCACGRYGGNA